MKPHSKKKQIKVAIGAFFEMLNPGETIKSEDVVKFCKRRTGKYVYPDSVLRYLREMRQDGVINYNCECKSERRFRILALGECHSL